MAEALACVEVEPSAGPQAGTVVWMHGLGADGHDFEPIVPMLGLPDVRFVFPHAPAIPVTINGGLVMRAWFDVLTLEHRRGREDEGQIRRSAELVKDVVDRERGRGVAGDRIVIAGFSQGGAMALHVGTRYPEELAGIMVLSGYHVLSEAFEAERSQANLATPMLFCHGALDPLVPIARGKQAHDAMAVGGRNVAWHAYPMEHEICIPEIAEIGAWLRQRLSAP